VAVVSSYGLHVMPCKYQENAGVDSVCVRGREGKVVCVHVAAKGMLSNSLQETVKNFQTKRCDANGKSLYNKEPKGRK
jgi:hypothetical protein